MKKVWLMAWTVFGLSAILFSPLTETASAQPHRFSTNERAIGATTRDWTFMSAWNLSTDDLQVSPAWFHGNQTWTFTRPAQQQWIAKFIYRCSAATGGRQCLRKEGW